MLSVIPTVSLIEELTSIMTLEYKEPILKCTIFEDNNGALELARAPIMRPRTKHIALKYHHFRSFVKFKYVRIEPIDTTEQLTDIFTKPLVAPIFLYLRKQLMGW